MKKILWPALAFIFMGITIYQCENKDYDHDINNIKNQQEIVQKEIDSALAVNDSLKKLSVIKQFKIDSLKGIVKALEKEIVKINLVKDEKINSIDNYTPGELQQYFTDRYSGND